MAAVSIVEFRNELAFPVHFLRKGCVHREKHPRPIAGVFTAGSCVEFEEGTRKIPERTVYITPKHRFDEARPCWFPSPSLVHTTFPFLSELSLEMRHPLHNTLVFILINNTKYRTSLLCPRLRFAYPRSPAIINSSDEQSNLIRNEFPVRLCNLLEIIC